ncbi:MAG: hypothetical protein ACTS9Y_02085 [Methylophilus sp.]|uniref:hypothetical protein n=1 Tax=Methylophilus sp. TaxID=29541 RepID=UPI003FA04831
MVKPISKKKLLNDLYINARIHQMIASYLFNVVARDKTIAGRSCRLAEKLQYRAINYYQRAAMLENLDIDMINDKQL